MLLAAVIPPIVLLIKVYRMDNVEREPVGLIVSLFIWGAVMTFFASLAENYLINDVIKPRAAVMTATQTSLVTYFLGVGLVEELCKYIALKHKTWRHPAFNYKFDGIVYAVSVSLGFAAAENIMYVGRYGLGVALVRLLTAIPGHCIFGIYMGYYYGMAKHAERMGRWFRKRYYLLMAVLMPMILHGFYDFCASSKSGPLTIGFYAYVIILNIVAFSSLRKFSEEDSMV